MSDLLELLSISLTFSHSSSAPHFLFISFPGLTYPFFMALGSEVATLVPKSVFPKLSFSVTMVKMIWSRMAMLQSAVAKEGGFIYCIACAF